MSAAVVRAAQGQTSAVFCPGAEHRWPGKQGWAQHQAWQEVANGRVAFQGEWKVPEA